MLEKITRAEHERRRRIAFALHKARMRPGQMHTNDICACGMHTGTNKTDECRALSNCRVVANAKA
jgi:hypothetical protein